LLDYPSYFILPSPILTESISYTGIFISSSHTNPPKYLLNAVIDDFSDCLEDIDAVVTTGYVIYRTKDETINLPFSMKNPSERYTGRAFHNDRLLTKLRAKALEFPTVRIIQGTVESLIESGAQVTGVTYTVEGDTPENKRTIKAPLTLVADGCFSKFLSQTNDLKHRFPKENPKTISSNFTGIVLRNIEMPHEGCGHVMLTSPTPMLFYRISSTEVRALVDVPKDSELPSLDHIREVVAPQLPPKLKKALLDAMDEQDNCKTMPNFKLHPSPLIRPGMIVLGDALNIRHPLTGGGMTVAFSDMARVTPLLAPISDFASHTDVMNAYKHFFAQRKALASTVNILAQALYRVFGQCSDDERVSAMIRSACFAYFQLGGECVNGPISLLSGVIESPWTLLYHYARVGIYGAWIFKTQPIMAVKILIAVYHVFKPLMESELDSQAAEWAPSPSQ
jgi:squalene monooxygenase